VYIQHRATLLGLDPSDSHRLRRRHDSATLTSMLPPPSP
jgi:hypothetical protein